MNYYTSIIISIVTLMSSLTINAQLNVTNGGDIHVGFDSLWQTGESIPYLFYDADNASLYGGYNTLGLPDYRAQNSLIFGEDAEVEGANNAVFGRVNNCYGDLNLVGGINNYVASNNNVVWGTFNAANEGATLNIIGGESNVVFKDYKLNTVWGSQNNVKGDYNLVSGSRNTIQESGQFCTISGYQNAASGTNTTVRGIGNRGIFSNALIIGSFNSTADATYIQDSLIESPNDPLFIVGNGIDDANRSNALVITKSGRVGIGKSRPQAGIDIKEGSIILSDDIMIKSLGDKQLGINGSVIPTKSDLDLGGAILKWRNIYATNGVIQTSDIRLKKDVTAMNNVLDKVLQLKPIQYHLTAGDDGHLSTGLSAQAVEKIFPEVVSKSTVTYKEKQAVDQYGIRYTELIPIVIKAIQEQQVIINKQQQQIDQLLANQEK